MRFFAFLKIAVLTMAAFLQSCYTFKSSTIPQEVKTFWVQNFTISTNNAPASIGIEFTESLKDKIRSQSRLRLNENEPNCEFSGQITQFSITPVAPKPGETVSFNQLNIAVQVHYEDKPDEKRNADFSKSFFADFSASSDLLSVQNALIDEIFKQLTEDVFNQAFNNW